MVIAMMLGAYPSYSIADAREWVTAINQKVEKHIDPLEDLKAMKLRQAITVARAHGLYMTAVREGRGSSSKRPNAPRTIADKLTNQRSRVPAVSGNRALLSLPLPGADLVQPQDAQPEPALPACGGDGAAPQGHLAVVRQVRAAMLRDPSRRLCEGAIRARIASATSSLPSASSCFSRPFASCAKPHGRACAGGLTAHWQRPARSTRPSLTLSPGLSDPRQR